MCFDIAPQAEDDTERKFCFYFFKKRRHDRYDDNDEPDRSARRFLFSIDGVLYFLGSVVYLFRVYTLYADSFLVFGLLDEIPWSFFFLSWLLSGFVYKTRGKAADVASLKTSGCMRFFCVCCINRKVTVEVFFFGGPSSGRKSLV